MSAGLVEIRMRRALRRGGGTGDHPGAAGPPGSATVVHSPSTDPAIVLRSVAEAAASALLDELDDGMTIAASGGEALCALIEALAPRGLRRARRDRPPAACRASFRTDVNHVASPWPRSWAARPTSCTRRSSRRTKRSGQR